MLSWSLDFVQCFRRLTPHAPLGIFSLPLCVCLCAQSCLKKFNMTEHTHTYKRKDRKYQATTMCQSPKALADPVGPFQCSFFMSKSFPFTLNVPSLPYSDLSTSYPLIHDRAQIVSSSWSHAWVLSLWPESVVFASQFYLNPCISFLELWLFEYTSYYSFLIRRQRFCRHFHHIAHPFWSLQFSLGTCWRINSIQLYYSLNIWCPLE